MHALFTARDGVRGGAACSDLPALKAGNAVCVCAACVGGHARQAMVPRQSYLPLSFFSVLPTFQEAVAAVYGPRELWFEHKGVPLKWCVPSPHS
jgi:hypothetical protein